MISDGLILSKYVEPIDEEIVTSMSKSFNIIEEKIRISILSNNGLKLIEFIGKANLLPIDIIKSAFDNIKLLYLTPWLPIYPK